MKKKLKDDILRPPMSWERPIEQAILGYVRHMARHMEDIAGRPREKGWFANNEVQDGAQRMATAYRTVENAILREMKIRKL